MKKYKRKKSIKMTEKHESFKIFLFIKKQEILHNHCKILNIKFFKHYQ